MPAELDQTDRKILGILQEEGRISNAALARRIGLTAAPTLERVRRLEREGVITGYAARIDGDAVGMGLTVFASVSLEAHELRAVEDFRAAVTALPGILECHHLTGEADFLLKVRAADMGSYETFLREHLLALPGVQRIRSSVVLSTLKEGGAIQIEEAVT